MEVLGVYGICEGGRGRNKLGFCRIRKNVECSMEKTFQLLGWPYDGSVR